MKSRALAALACIGLAVSLVGAADAQIRLDRPVGGGGGSAPAQQPGGTIASITPELAIRILQQVGFKGGETAEQGEVKIVKMDLNGQQALVILADCKPDGCTSYTIGMNFGRQDVTTDFVNSFNRNYGYGRVYLTKESVLILALNGHTFGGITPLNFARDGALFGNLVQNLVSFKQD